MYTQQEFNSESVACWSALRQYQVDHTLYVARSVWEKFVSPTAPFPVNVSYMLKRQLTEHLQELWNASIKVWWLVVWLVACLSWPAGGWPAGCECFTSISL
jgi:hypothetical protein